MPSCCRVVFPTAITCVGSDRALFSDHADVGKRRGTEMVIGTCNGFQFCARSGSAGARWCATGPAFVCELGITRVEVADSAFTHRVRARVAPAITDRARGSCFFAEETTPARIKRAPAGHFPLRDG